MAIDIVPAEEGPALEEALALVARVYPDFAVTVAEHRGYVGAYPHASLLARIDGATAGYGLAVREPELRARRGAFARVIVEPRLRGRGAGTALLRALSGWAREHDVAVFEGNVREDEPDSLAWATRRGYEEFGRESELHLDLAGVEAPAVAPPEGIEIVPWSERPEAARGLYDVYLEASPDIPGFEDDEIEPFDDWLAHHLAGPGDRPDATFVALAGEEVVGYAKYSLTEAQPAVAFHDLTGVKRAWRGRGVASALKRAQIAWAKEHGYAELRTMNEERNAPIRHLNERYGYRLAPGRIFVRGPLA